MRQVMALAAGVGLTLLVACGRGGPSYAAEVDYCHRQVLDRIATPATARFLAAEEELPYRDGSFVLNGFVDAQNLFGAMVRTSYRCHVEAAPGGGLQLRSFDWKRA